MTIEEYYDSKLKKCIKEIEENSNGYKFLMNEDYRKNYIVNTISWEKKIYKRRINLLDSINLIARNLDKFEINYMFRDLKPTQLKVIKDVIEVQLNNSLNV